MPFCQKFSKAWDKVFNNNYTPVINYLFFAILNPTTNPTAATAIMAMHIATPMPMPVVKSENYGRELYMTARTSDTASCTAIMVIEKHMQIMTPQTVCSGYSLYTCENIQHTWWCIILDAVKNGQRSHISPQCIKRVKVNPYVCYTCYRWVITYILGLYWWFQPWCLTCRNNHDNQSCWT